MISVIIPTMWKVDFKSELDFFENSPAIEEIILINNDKKNTPDWLIHDNYSKLLTITPFTNLYVNPSWNLATKVATSDNVMLFNDDIKCQSYDFLSICDDLLEKEDVLIGCSKKSFEIDNTSDIQISTLNGQRDFGFGSIMMLRKNSFKSIPDVFKIWYGDDLLIDLFRKKAQDSVKVIENISLKGSKMEATSSLFDDVRLYDREIYNKNNNIVEEYLKV